MNTGFLFSEPDDSIPIFQAEAPDDLEEPILLDHPHPARNQGDVPCCVSCAIVTCLECIDAQSGSGSPPLSELFHYFHARDRTDDLSGMTIRHGLHEGARRGVCQRAFHDYEITRENADLRPSDRAFENARQRTIGTDGISFFGAYVYEQVSPEEHAEAWRSALMTGNPLAVAFRQSADFFKYARPSPGSDYEVDDQEGHAVAVLGFNDAQEVFMIKDSFGEARGDDGVWLLPYDAVASPFVIEAWVLRAGEYG